MKRFEKVTIEHPYIKDLASIEALYRYGCVTGMTVAEDQQLWNKFVTQYNKCCDIFKSELLELFLEKSEYENLVQAEKEKNIKARIVDLI